MKNAIFIIEDDHWVASYMADVIQTFFGLKVLIAGSSSRAVELWQSNRHSIVTIISDLSLPCGTNGEALVRELTQDAHEIPIVFITGNLRDCPQLAESFGRPVSLLLKPFGPLELNAVLKKSISSLAEAPV
jgi:CheY-like chemotaxis protein